MSSSLDWSILNITLYAVMFLAQQGVKVPLFFGVRTWHRDNRGRQVPAEDGTGSNMALNKFTYKVGKMEMQEACEKLTTSKL